MIGNSNAYVNFFVEFVLEFFKSDGELQVFATTYTCWPDTSEPKMEPYMHRQKNSSATKRIVL
jgi:hypothetical protein